jgi:Tol biopolymer transport system component
MQIVETATGGVWIYDISRGALSRLTLEGGITMPVWTPDGRRIVVAVNRRGGTGLFWKPADGSGPEERLTTSESNLGGPSVSPDGQTLAFETRPTTGPDLWVVPLQGERKPQIFLQTPSNERDPRFSPPDGRWLAYVSNESGRNEVYVRPYPGPGGQWLISTEGGAEPVWARNGRELFYRNVDKMMVVDIQTQPAFKAGIPRMLFELPGYQGTRQYDVAPEETTLTQINVVLNWFEELNRRVPAPQ